MSAMFRFTSVSLVLASALVAGAQNGKNGANWELANRFSPDNIQLFVGSATLNPTFLAKSDKFWYRWRDANSAKFYLVDPAAKKRRLLFDHVKMAAQLSELTKRPYDEINLPITTLDFDDKGESFRFAIDRNWFEYTLKTETLAKSTARNPNAQAQEGPGQGQGGGGGQGFGQGQGANTEYRDWSPDKKRFAYAQNHNLYLVEVDEKKKEGEPVQLSTDGVEYYSFGSTRSTLGVDSGAIDATRKVRPNVTWSPDSKRFFIPRTDSRKVKELWLVNVLSEPRPTLMTYKYAMPGDEFVSQIELYGWDLDSKKLSKIKTEKYKDQRLQNIHYPNTSDRLRYIRRDRLQRNMEFVEIDMKTGMDRVLFGESVENAFIETRTLRYIKDGGESIWWSERTGWGHLYRYDAEGKLKNTITSGAWRVENVVDVDAEKGLVWFTAVGREPAENPYYEHLYRCKLDGSELTLLNPGDANHTAELSTSKKFIVDTMSRVDMAPKMVVRNDQGDIIMELENMDLSRLNETGWKMASTFKVKSADGLTDNYGNMWKPFDFDPKKKYPIILHVYPGPQTEGVTDTFSASSSTQQLAQLGFIVVQIGNRGGNPQRSNAYHSFGYFNLRDYGLADKKAAVEQLAAKYPWIDINRVGIYGHSGGGFMTAAALLTPPFNTFFKVGVSSAGNHDNNIYNQNWSEQHHGLREVRATATGTTGTTGGGQGGGRRGPPPPDGDPEDVIDSPQLSSDMKFEIKVPTTVEMAANLKGKLLLVHGTMDNNVHPGNTERLVNALIKANKRFDYMPMPGQAHGFGTMNPYFQQLMWEYFSRHLLGDTYDNNSEISEKKGG